MKVEFKFKIKFIANVNPSYIKNQYFIMTVTVCVVFVVRNFGFAASFMQLYSCKSTQKAPDHPINKTKTGVNLKLNTLLKKMNLGAFEAKLR